VGTALIDFIRSRARSLGLTDIRVDHWAFNARAGSFFEACGFWPMKVMLRQQ
jgi:GNAT superfamily N-acetyltransferase